MMATELDTYLKEVADIKAFVVKRVEEHEALTKQELDRMTRALTDATAKLQTWERERASRSVDGKLVIPDGKLAGFTLFDTYILMKILEGRANSERPMPQFREHVLEQRALLRKAIGSEVVLAWGDWAERTMALRTPDRSALSDFRAAVGGWNRAIIAECVRALDSTTAGAGDELVPTFQAAELWMDVNLETQILPLLPQSPMPTNPFDHPIQFGDANWYPSDENVQVTTTNLATQKVTLTAYGLKTGVAFSDELNEDAIIALVPELRAGLVRNAAEAIDDVLLNADSTAIDGINTSGATIAKTTAGKAQYLLGFDGMRHLPVVDNTAQQTNAAAAIAASHFLSAMALLGKYGTPRRQSEVVFISDVRTHVRALGLAQVETMEKVGARATISTGELAQVYGVPYIRSAQMVRTQSTGAAANTAAANTTGNILAVNTTQWRVGFRRAITLENDREAGKGQTTMYVSFRIALTERSGTRSSATHTAITRNITGV